MNKKTLRAKDLGYIRKETVEQMAEYDIKEYPHAGTTTHSQEPKCPKCKALLENARYSAGEGNIDYGYECTKCDYSSF